MYRVRQHEEQAHTSEPKSQQASRDIHESWVWKF
jgi:hypothetical protein